LQFVKPKKALGQHFLNNKIVAEKIVESLSDYQNILEIGPGTGILTQFLLKKKIDLRLVEIDNESVSFLISKLKINKNIIYNQDFLKLNLSELFENKNFSIIGNFPYNISSQILFKIIDNRELISEMCGMFQYEVAERICEKEGTKKYGILSVLTQAFFDTKLLFEVPNKFFVPPPKVNSAVILLKRKKNLKINCDEKLFFKIVKISFQQRRKTLRNSLKQLNLTDNLREHIIFDKRPEQLSVNQFVDLTNLVNQDLKYQS
tara:strand:+ start:1678 stop:2460 length:783 start_codon:yes stop_codon:yes gene_type:complete